MIFLLTLPAELVEDVSNVEYVILDLEHHVVQISHNSLHRL